MLPTYPTLIDRIQSSFIDLLFILLISFAAGYLFDQFEEVPSEVRMALFVGLWAVYEPLMTTMGGTLGNRLKGIRVRRQNDLTRKINFPRALIRYALKILLGWISFLTIHMNKERRAIHDLVAGSVMIRYGKEDEI